MHFGMCDAERLGLFTFNQVVGAFEEFCSMNTCRAPRTDSLRSQPPGNSSAFRLWGPDESVLAFVARIGSIVLDSCRKKASRTKFDIVQYILARFKHIALH